jgi:dTMP kinase
MPRAPFLVLDGLDGSGKSTQCRLLADWLRGRGWAVTTGVDPGGTSLGRQLREIVLHHPGAVAPACEALLFMASRAQLVAEVIEPALAAGRAVVCDRFLLANVVYQGHAGGLDPEMLWEVGRLSTGGVEPDLTVVLDLPVEQAVARRGRPADRLERRGADFHEGVRRGFLAEVARRPDRIRVVDARPGVEAVRQAICEEVGRVIR